MKKSKDDFEDIQKGITTWDSLNTHYDFLQEKYRTTYVETDMRAMYNPSRMSFIEKVAQKLINKIKSTCPDCNTPGLGITTVKEGLLCSLCNRPTASTLCYVYNCVKCDFTKEEMYPNQKEFEEPMFCNFCNP